jgi:hypothetical protein
MKWKKTFSHARRTGSSLASIAAEHYKGNSSFVRSAGSRFEAFLLIIFAGSMFTYGNFNTQPPQ